MPLRVDLAEEALRAVAEEVGLSVYDVAAGAVRIANVKMAEAISISTVHRGLDPRDFALLAFGGAGPAHACEIAEELQIPEILVPPTPGVFSALGLMRAPVRTVAVRSLNVSTDAAGLDRTLEETYRQLETECATVLAGHGVDERARIGSRRAALRYPGQSFDVTVSTPATRDGAVPIAELIEEFHRRHSELYSYVIRDEVPFLVTVEVSLEDGRELDAAAGAAVSAPEADAPEPGAARRVYYLSSGDWVETPVHVRSALAAGHRLAGPALIDQVDSTVLIADGFEGRIDDWGNLLLSRRGA
jgi:N-methylhydantoinase A